LTVIDQNDIVHLPHYLHINQKRFPIDN